MPLTSTYTCFNNTEDRIFSAENLLLALKDFRSTIDREDIGFFHLTGEHDQIRQVQDLHKKYQHKKTFVQIGIGGSALGPEMLIDSLAQSNVQFYFWDNIDPDDLHQKMTKLSNPQETLFYVVSKSGGTAETVANFAIALEWLSSCGVAQDELGDYLVFCTDPHHGDLRKMANDLKIDCLNLPHNVGGRFSVLTAVGLFPALFAGIDIEKLYIGANKMKVAMLSEDIDHNPLLQSYAHLFNLMQEKQVSQTVIMPYSSKLRSFGHWFVQLWAESLGKVRTTDGAHVGLTPIPSYGATDQHSQVQLFMEGPFDKCLLIIGVKKFQWDYSLKSAFSYAPFKKLEKHNLSDLMQAELQGTLMALTEQKRPHIFYEIDQVNEEELGGLILFFESLTALMGNELKIDAFNQPGVELGKQYAYELLAKKL